MRTAPTRRDVLGAACGVLAAGALWPSALRAGDAPDSGNFKFIAVNDLHYVDEKCGKWLEGAFKQMGAHEGVDFCLLLGDLAEDGRRDQLHAVKDIVGGTKLDTKIIIGNHDYTLAGSRAEWDDAYPGTLNYAFEHRGWQFIACDSTQGRAGKDTVIAKDSIDYLHQQVPKFDKKRPTALFTHFPLGWLVPASPNNRTAALAAFDGVNLQAVFNGHFHGRTTRQHQHATITTNQCCSLRHPNHDGTKEKGYFLCEAKNGEVTRTFFEVKVT